MIETEYLKVMGRKIKSVRKEKKMTLLKLGNLCNLDYIADKLGVNVKDLF